MMQKSLPSENSPFIEENATSFQFSLSTLLIAMAVFSLMSALLLWACRLPLVTNELHAWMGSVPSTNRDGTDRHLQLMFLLFCYSSPLLLAATLNLIFVAVRTTARCTRQSDLNADKQWEMES